MGNSWNEEIEDVKKEDVKKEDVKKEDVKIGCGGLTWRLEKGTHDH